MSKKSGNGSSTRTNYRDAGSGEYVTKRYAETHKSTTVKETDKAPQKKR